MLFLQPWLTKNNTLLHHSGVPGEQLPARFRPELTYPFMSFSIPLIWGAVLLLSLLVVAVVLFAVMAKRKGR